MEKRISYVKKPHGERGIIGIILGVVSFILVIVSIYLASITNGNAKLDMAAYAVCAILTMVVGISFSVLGLIETDKNKLLPRIGIGINGIVLIVFVGTFILAI
jgi:hypothetical protein